MTLAKREVVQEYEVALRRVRRARRDRRSLDLQRDQRGAGGRRPRRRGLAAGERRLRLHLDRDSPGHRADVLPQPWRRQRRARWPTWCTRPRCITRIASRAPASHACCSRGASVQAADVDHIRRSLQERLGHTVETVDVSAAAAFADRITAAPDVPRYDRSAGRPARSRPGGGRMIRTNLSTRPFYNEGTVALLARGARSSSSSRPPRSTSRG